MSLLARRRGVLGAFDPRSIPGLALWLDASQITGLVDGDPVGTWADKSGNGRDATQATAAAKPAYRPAVLNGKAVVRLDGVDDLVNLGDLSAAFPSAATLFVVWTAAASDDQYCVYETAAIDSWWKYLADGYIGTFRSARLSTYPTGTPQAGSHLACILSTTADYEMRIDGTSEGAQAGAFLSGTSHMLGASPDGGGTRHLNGDVAELVVYNSGLSLSDRQRVERYLGNKYAIAVA